MTQTKPSDFLPLKEWHAEYGKPAFTSAKMLHYFVFPLERELIEAGAMARVGKNIFLHRDRFWPEFQRIQANASNGEQKDVHPEGP